MIKRWFALTSLMFVLMVMPVASAKPVFDCTDSKVAYEHPAQCPGLGVPTLLGPHVGGGGPHGGSCNGLCGLVRDVVNSIPGLGGFLH